MLRAPFPEHQINKLPKPTKAQTDEVKADFKKGIRCDQCGGWHHPKVVHLDYVGHAALTDRLLDADLLWTWEPLAFEDGLPKFDSTGGLWIKLTVGGHTRLGYGNASKSDMKEIGSREKEVIGDALRNAAMRFGAALDLWHKGELHEEEKNEVIPPQIKPVSPTPKSVPPKVGSASSAPPASVGFDVGEDFLGASVPRSGPLPNFDELLSSSRARPDGPNLGDLEHRTKPLPPSTTEVSLIGVGKVTISTAWDKHPIAAHNAANRIKQNVSEGKTVYANQKEFVAYGKANGLIDFTL